MSDQHPFEPSEQSPAPEDQTLLPAPPPGGYGDAPGAGYPMPPAGGFAMPPGWAPGTPPPPRDSIWHRIAAFVVLGAVIAGTLGAFAGFSLARAVSPQLGRGSDDSESPIQAQLPSGSASGGTLNTAAIAAKVDPAIVDVNTVLGNGQAAGTGMIISSTGEVLTNNHVVTGSTSITVTIQGRSQSYAAHVVGVDAAKDVAVIQIDGNVSGLPHVTFAKSSSLAVGDPVVALGNALGQGGTPNATQGTITDLDQTITASEGGGQSETLTGMIESDAVIYEGDSGGALVNSSGQVVGMITAGQTQGFRSSASTVGYAIPADTALSTANRIRAHEQAADLTYGKVGFMGVSVQNLDSFTAAQLGLNISSGALVISVQPGSPAADAGIARYDVITNVGGTSVTSSETLGRAIKSHQPGDSVSVTWVDQSGSHHANVTLGGVNP